MQLIAKYRKLFAEKLVATDDFHAAFTKAVWTSYIDGYNEGVNDHRNCKPKEAQAADSAHRNVNQNCGE